MKILGRGAGRGPKNNCFIKPFFPGRIVKIINIRYIKRQKSKKGKKQLPYHFGQGIPNTGSIAVCRTFRYQSVINRNCDYFYVAGNQPEDKKVRN